MELSITCKLADFGIVTFKAQYGVYRGELSEIGISDVVQAGAALEPSNALYARLTEEAHRLWGTTVKLTYEAQIAELYKNAPARFWS